MDSAVAEAARNGHFDVVQWLCTHTTVKSTEGAMSNAAYSEHFNIVRWLHENRSELYSTMVMDSASLRGNLAMLKWLRANRPNEGYSTSAYGCSPRFSINRLAVIRWLTAVPPLKTFDHKQMRNAVMNNNLDVVLFWNSAGYECYGIDWGMGLEINAHILAWLREELNIEPSENYRPDLYPVYDSESD